MSKQIGGQEMRDLAKNISAEIPGLCFALFVFEKNAPGISNYISNANREDMILALKETINRFENKEDFPTPESN